MEAFLLGAINWIYKYSTLSCGLLFMCLRSHGQWLNFHQYTYFIILIFRKPKERQM